MELHLGKIVLDKVKERGMKKSEFARRINKSRQNVQDIFKRHSLDTQLLFDISKVLEFNFFEIFTDQLAKDSSGYLMEERASYKNGKQERSRQRIQTDNLSKQLKQAQKEIDYLKKINTLLEKKKPGASKKKNSRKK